MELVRGNQALHGFDDVRAGGRNQDALEVGVASGIVTVGVVPGDFDHAGYSLADARLGSGERVVVAVLGKVGLDAFHREELVETATGRLLLGAGQELGGQLRDVAVFEKEFLERVRVFETVFAGQHQQSGDVAAAFRGGNYSGGIGGYDAGAAAGIRQPLRLRRLGLGLVGENPIQLAEHLDAGGRSLADFAGSENAAESV